MGRFVRAAATADIPPGCAMSVSIEGRRYALFRDADGSFHATDDLCPHEGGSLSEGTYHDGRVICPLHAWVFDVRTGSCLSVPDAELACYATRAVGSHVHIEIPVVE